MTMKPWLLLAAYIITYDWWAAHTGRPTLSAHARQLDHTPPARYLAAAFGFYVFLHLFGPRRWPFTPWIVNGRR